MKKITFILILCWLLSWSGYAQFGCGSAIAITDGFSQSGITTPGNGGFENWVNENSLDFSQDHPNPINVLYFSDDVYLFSYTADSNVEISMTIMSRNSWNGIAIFSGCNGNVLTGYRDGFRNTEVDGPDGKTVSTSVSAGETVYIAVGQWGSPYDLDFDVLNFSVASIDQVPNCITTLARPAALTDVSIRTNIAWNAMAGGVLGYKLSIGTDAGLNDILDSYDVGNVTAYTPTQSFDFSTTYYVNVTPYNAIGGAEGCEDISFTTMDPPAPGNLCENAIVVTSFPYTATDDTANYSDEYYEGSPGENGCGSTSNYLNGNDVVYSFTPAVGGSYRIVLTTAQAWAGAFIYTSCNAIGQNCYAGEVNSEVGGVVFENFQATAGQTYYLVISSFPSPQTIQYTLDITENTCTNLTAAYTVVSDCANIPQFKISVNVSDMGSADAIAVSDNQNSTPVIVTEAGIVEMGPYPNGTSVIITAANTADASCTRISTALTQNACPPANDECSAAIVLTPGADFDISKLLTTNVAATRNANNPTPTCDESGFVSNGKDIWFTVVVPASGTLTIETRGDGSESITDTGIQAYNGTCDTLESLGCNADDGEGNFSLLSLSGLIANEIIYVRVWGYNGVSGTFYIAAYDESLRTCTNLTASYTVVSDCANAPQFKISVNVSDMGSADAVAVSDNQNSTPVIVTQSGIVEMGPYPNGTSVIITAANTADASCTKISTVLTQNTCPPVNDECSAAIVLIPGMDFDASKLLTTNLAATRNANNPTPSCENYNFTTNGKDIWFAVAVPASGTLTVETRGDGSESITDTGIEVYRGDCGTLTSLGCNADDGDGYFSLLSLSALTADEVVYIRAWGYNGASGSFYIAAYDESLRTCTNLTTTYTVVPDCSNTQFSINVNITNLGSATSVVITDNQNSEPITVAQSGVITIGPYPASVYVVVTAANVDDVNCVRISSPIGSTCPPANDECSDATLLASGATFDLSKMLTTNVAATRSANDPTPTCDAYNFSTNGKDIWFTVAVPASGTLTLETRGDGSGSITDTGVEAYRGTCGALEFLGCNTDDGDGNFSKLAPSGLIANEIIYVRIWGYDGTSGTFYIAAYDASLNNTDFETSNFSVYPNPVKNILNISYISNISNVEVFNLVGQQVLIAKMNTTLGQVNMTHLPTGTYFVKINADNKTKIVKVVKQ